MLRTIVRRLLWPGLGFGLLVVTLVQAGAIEPRFLERATAGSLFGPGFCSEPSPASPSTTQAPPARIVAEGRVVAYPGAEVVVGSESAGRIVAMPVAEKSIVRKGDMIAELNSADLEASREETLARIAEADADERHFERELRREMGLIARRAGTAQNLDSLQHDLDASRARRAAAVAGRERYSALIAKTRILAPIDGVVIARHVHPGETIEDAAKVVTIADLSRLRIEAEVDEFDSPRVALGAPVILSAEGHDTTWPGRIEEIPDAVVGRKLRPEDPGRPVDARILPVKIALASPGPLKLGQRVEVSIETGRKSDSTAIDKPPH